MAGPPALEAATSCVCVCGAAATTCSAVFDDWLAVTAAICGSLTNIAAAKSQIKPTNASPTANPIRLCKFVLMESSIMSSMEVYQTIHLAYDELQLI